MSHGVVNHVNREDAAFLDRPQNVQKLLDQTRTQALKKSFYKNYIKWEPRDS